MKKIIIILLISSYLFSEQAIVGDRFFSPYAGAYDILFTHWTLRNGEDYFHRNEVANNTLQVWGRTAAQLFWTTLNGTLQVTQHEFFGHGYRLRELGERPQKYQITPIEGFTVFEVPETFPVGKMLAVTVSGLEAEGILAHKIKSDWMSLGKIDGRLSTLYTKTEQSLFWYTLITALGKLKGNIPIEGNDIEDYLQLLNASYPNDKLTIGTLTKWAAFNWLDPMTFFAYFSWFYYIATGTSWEFPTFHLGENLRYLPNVRIGFAPYAPEAYLENFFSFDRKVFYLYLKGGKRSLGAGIGYDYLFSGEKGKLGFLIDGWWQNQFISNASLRDFVEGQNVAKPVLQQKILGIAASLTSTLNFSPNTGLFAQIGGKTNGYLPGYSLKGGLIARVGFVVGQH